jgi:5-methyltetrahydrofolate--homocysteine methyltransferase
MSTLMAKINQAVIEHNIGDVEALVKQAVAEKVAVSEIINEGLVKAMNLIGERFKTNDVFIPEVLVSARAMGAGMEILKPLIIQAGIKEKGVIVIGTVKDDLHDIGIKLVTMMFEGGGYKVVNLGIDVSDERFLEAVGRHKPDIVGLAALLTTTMPRMRETIASIKARYPAVKVMIGGAPVTQKFATEINADLYAADGVEAVAKANELLVQ